MEKLTSTSITIEQIKELFVLDPITRKVHHNPDRPRHTFLTNGAHKCFKTRWGGKPVRFSVTNQGYLVAVSSLLRLRITFSEHHLVFVLFNGKQVEPGHVVDHINHVREDNRPENLRELTFAENMTNMTHFINVEANEDGKKRMKYAIENLTDGRLKLELFFADGQCFFVHDFDTEAEAKAAINGIKKIEA